METIINSKPKVPLSVCQVRGACPAPPPHEQPVVAAYARIAVSCFAASVTVQVEVHPYWRQEKIHAWCNERGIHLTAFSPLGSPDSATIFKRTGPPLLENETVREIGKKHGRNVGQARWALEAAPPARAMSLLWLRTDGSVVFASTAATQVLIKWALQQRPGCSVLPKSTSPERIKARPPHLVQATLASFHDESV